MPRKSSGDNTIIYTAICLMVMSIIIIMGTITMTSKEPKQTNSSPPPASSSSSPSKQPSSSPSSTNNQEKKKKERGRKTQGPAKTRERIPGGEEEFPMIISGIADPTIIYCDVNKEYVIAGTSGNFNGFVSKGDLKKWQPIGPILQGAAGMDWAPDIVAFQNTYYLAFTRNTRLFMAKSTTGKARGPYKQIAGPLLNKWSIDSHVCVHNNTPYILWNEGDGVKVGILNSAMTSISNAKHAFGVNTHPEGWITQTVQEAPCVLPYKGRFLIFFSGNSTGPKYGIGVCVADHPYHGPFRKLKKNPLLQKNGSGHCSITKDSKGYVIAFHMGGNRSTHLGRITFGDDDTPRITSF